MKIELGIKSGEDSPVVNVGTSEKSVYYPSLYLDMNGKDSGCKVGDTVKAVVELKLVSESHNISGQGKRVNCSFDVMSIDFDYENESKEDDD
jgi:hypothetical protein